MSIAGPAYDQLSFLVCAEQYLTSHPECMLTYAQKHKEIYTTTSYWLQQNRDCNRKKIKGEEDALKPSITFDWTFFILTLKSNFIFLWKYSLKSERQILLQLPLSTGEQSFE